MRTKSKPTGLKAKLDKVFSQYIRLRDMIGNTRTFQCISCGRILPINQADCGHYINRQHMATRFSELNCNAQCRSCNRFDEGNMQGYRRNLVWRHGENQVLILESMKHEIHKYTDFEYKVLIEHYQKEIKRLLKEKGLDITCLTK